MSRGASATTRSPCLNGPCIREIAADPAGPRSILMATGNPVTQAFYEEAGIQCQTVEINEITKAAGGIGCLTGIIERKLV